jgi:fluoride exporter
MSYLWVGIGGAAGSMLRFWLNGLVSNTAFGAIFPLGTMVINITGSFVIGIFGAMTSPESRFDPHWRSLAVQLLMVGLCGGYTTFSSFSLQTLNLARDGEWLFAGWNIVLSVVLCLAGVWLGYTLGEMINK